MEFYEKLQELRKKRGLTQEELAEALYVSRTTISKWESGRGYPNIESLKDISKYFSISIDDLLSSEKVLFIAEKENDKNIRAISDFVFGCVDCFALLLIVLPIYPHKVGNHIYSVNLFEYVQIAVLNRYIYWLLFGALVALGTLKVFGVKCKVFTSISLFVHVLAVMLLVLTREAYAGAILFVLFVMKSLLILKTNNV